LDKKLKNRKKEQKEKLLSRMMRDPDSGDVLGSYTGTALDGGEPDQDADDL
jgi:hypothetical protein